MAAAKGFSGMVTGERLATAREVAELLGFAPGTIVDWFEAGKIPGFRIGGRLRFRLSEVEAWLEERRGRKGRVQQPRRRQGRREPA